MWVKGESHFERLRTRGRTKSEDTKRDKTRNYVVWWRITTVYCANLTLSILEEKNRRDGKGWVQVRQNETRRNKKRQDEAFMLPDNDKPIMCFALTFWNRKRGGKEWDEMRRRWDIKSPDKEDPLYANLTWSILQEEERKEVNWWVKRRWEEKTNDW